ncbi:MAG: NAD(P)/FAD-dependent oxidoreductase [Burkholderiales bacterium]|nr:NAD(P)/FAD-dependent oxidoreductase [Burkholderiales bacterium]
MSGDAAAARLAALEARAREDLRLMSYPARDWVRPAPARSDPVLDVLIVGAGQSGLAAALALEREGVTRIMLVDASPAGFEGPWETYARMETLRTPKHSVGLEGGLPSLSARAWHAARYGAAAWEGFARVRRHDWMDYLRWLRGFVAAPVLNDTRAGALADAGDGLIEVPLAGPRAPARVFARHVVLATGFDGCGEWHVPEHIASAVPPDRLTHSNVPFDLARVAGRRVGILGHGASAFDTAGAALDAGARSVEICYRRRDIPQINPHRHLEYVGLLKHYPEMPAALRWEIAHFFDTRDQPPTQNAWDKATSYPNCRVRAGCPWLRVAFEGGEVRVDTPAGTLAYDFVVAATGSIVRLEARAELALAARQIARWRDRYTPPAALAHDGLADYPFVGAEYQLQPREAGTGFDWLGRVYAYNFSSYVSMGPHSTSVSAHKFSMPRMLRGITRALFFGQIDAVMPGIAAYDEIELNLGEKRIAA